MCSHSADTAAYLETFKKNQKNVLTVSDGHLMNFPLLLLLFFARKLCFVLSNPPTEDTFLCLLIDTFIFLSQSFHCHVLES